MQNSFTDQHPTLQLAAGKTHAVQLQQPVRVQVTQGLVWMTVEEGGADVWLRPGQRFDFHGGGLAVFEAVKADAEFTLVPLPGFWRRLAMALRQSMHGRQSVQPAAPRCTQPSTPCCAGPADQAPPTLVTRLLPRGLIRWF